MSIKLGLYNIIDNHFEEFLSYDSALKMALLEGDIEIYGRVKFKKTIDRADSVSLPALNKLLQDFNTVPKSDKGGLQKIYLGFIERICKPDKKNVGVKRNGNDEEVIETYSASDEYKFIKKQNEDEEHSVEAEQIIAERYEQLEELTQDAKLSDIEKHALGFLRSERKEKHPLLNNFTLNGIIQIANRGAYKLYYFNRVKSFAE